ncbi:hypothetical protein GCM10022255_115640 [Dactylosporangium darangshiense]|uniref:Uncharacterized protein n=1 Tax=Dactylosporangium darangshiense TaxID=579108 RepID=A0ABP8DW36_9ACTN
MRSRGPQRAEVVIRVGRRVRLLTAPHDHFGSTDLLVGGREILSAIGPVQPGERGVQQQVTRKGRRTDHRGHQPPRPHQGRVPRIERLVRQPPFGIIAEVQR